jgi:hypothetical protein
MISQQIAAEVAVVEGINLTTPFREPKHLGRGNEHMHFIRSAMKMCKRPLLRHPQQYWATEFAKWHSGEKKGRDPYIFWYMSQDWNNVSH